MPAGSSVVKFFMMVFGETFYSHMSFMERLTARLHLIEASSEEESDFIIAFVAVASRAGTDIEAALQEIPETPRPVVLVVLHHTFDPTSVAPQSRLGVDRTDVFTVDCVFYEDRGLLRCERNDVALKEVTDRLISIGASEVPLAQPRKIHPCVWIFIGFVVLAIIASFAVLLYLESTEHKPHKQSQKVSP